MLQCHFPAHSRSIDVTSESMDFDVVIVGAGPAGLSAACRLGQLAEQAGVSLSIAVIEKAAEIGGHVLSGAVIDTRSLDELFPDWRESGAPITTQVQDDQLHWLLGPNRSLRVPHALVPRTMLNRGHYIVSLGQVCRWFAARAEELGCDILTGFAATDGVYTDGRLTGIVTGERGIAADGTRKPNAEPGYVLNARAVLIAEGSRGSLAQSVEARFGLRADCDPPHYGLGLKEVWEVPTPKPGFAGHTFGWPLGLGIDGGGFIYHGGDGRVHLGLIVGLAYRNPYLSPFEEFQRWKMHPQIRGQIEGGRRLGYGARVVNKGGWHSIPRLSFPGGMLLGCAAGLLNPARIKGTHAAIESGVLAADTVFEALASGDGAELDALIAGRDGNFAGYEQRLRSSWLAEELRSARNFTAGTARFGLLGGGALAFLEHNLLRGRSPINLRYRTPDHAALLPASTQKRIEYAKPDGRVSFDRLSSVFLSNIAHDEDQPCHLELTDAALPIAANLPKYDEPAQRYCPANVYEVVEREGKPAFRINAANCLHCKCCEIKDPAQNIRWRPPEGGSGPNYAGM
jgi:electron-transferring-flavoprotein dehydrogenase